MGAHLLSDQLRHLGVAMTQSIDGYSGGEVKVSPVFEVPEVAAFAADHHGRWAHVGCYHELSMLVYQGCCSGIAGWVGSGEGGFFLGQDQYAELRGVKGHTDMSFLVFSGWLNKGTAIAEALGLERQGSLMQTRATLVHKAPEHRAASRIGMIEIILVSQEEVDEFLFLLFNY